MSKMKSMGLMMAMAAITGGLGMPSIPTTSKDDPINDPSRYKGKGFSGGQSKMREFVIDGFIIKATDLKMAKKKYAKMKL